MNPISSLTGVVTHPVRTAGFMAGLTIGVASGGVRTAGRLISMVAEHAPGLPIQSQASSSEVPSDTAASDMAPVEAVPTTPATTETQAAEAPANVAPSAKAAVVAPALGVPESEVVNSDDLSTPSGIPTDEDGQDLDTEPLLDPATAKAVASEADVLQRAADVNKG